MRTVRSELISLCKFKMSMGGSGIDDGVDSLVVVLHRLLQYCGERVVSIDRELLPYIRLFRECVKSIVENVKLQRNGSGAAKIIFDQFSGRAGSLLQRRIATLFGGTSASSSREGGSTKVVVSLPSDGGNAGGAVGRGVGGSRDGVSSGGGGGGSGDGGGRSGGGAGRLPPVYRFNPDTGVCFLCKRVGHIARNCALRAPPEGHQRN